MRQANHYCTFFVFVCGFGCMIVAKALKIVFAACSQKGMKTCDSASGCKGIKHALAMYFRKGKNSEHSRVVGMFAKGL